MLTQSKKALNLDNYKHLYLTCQVKSLFFQNTFSLDIILGLYIPFT